MNKSGAKLVCLGMALGFSLVTGCSKKETVAESTAAVETKDAFAVSEDINVLDNVQNNNISQTQADKSNISESSQEEVVVNETESADKRTEWEIQESLNIEMDESNATEEEGEEEAFKTSDDRYSLVLVYDRTEGDMLVFKNHYGENAEGASMAGLDTAEYRVNRLGVIEGVDELVSGDLATLYTNMHFDTNTQEFTKVWKVENTTATINEAVKSLTGEEEEVPDDEVANEDQGSAVN